MKPINSKIISAGTVMNAAINSTAQQLYDQYLFCIQVVFTGTPTGSFKLQASADPAYSGNPNTNGSGLNVAPIHWSDLDNTSVSVVAAGNVMWNYAWPGFNWVRVVYTDSSGGASTAIISSCVFNGKGQ